MNRGTRICIIVMAAVLMMLVPVQKAAADEQKKDIVIVIDPGHGGSQKGAEYNGLLEKDINMVVAKTMAEELEKYDGVKVYLTHDSPEDEMSIKERAEFADKVEADYFFCIHFNASGNHNFYGAETWVTSYGRYYAEMYAFSEILLQEFEEMGIYNRGIKTKLETDGTDYYGVLRRGAEFDIPAVIIEHCHMDNPEDSQFLSEEALIRFGELDAVAAAKFLGLKSSETGVDYSDFEVILPEEPKEPLQNDTTPPECSLVLVSMDNERQKAVFGIEASDEEYPILYYGYSFDGGEYFTPLRRWEAGQAYVEFELDYSQCVTEHLTVVVYNAFNMGTVSEKVPLEEVQEQIRLLENTLDNKASSSKETALVIEKQTGGELYLVIAALCLLGIVVAITGFIMDMRKTTKMNGNKCDKA
ncbi:MAG: N-acetylmuramoyl-L-alanine amidase [Thermoflexaceae bacterium]|nr:N-acetylmuramoyl-L-alanine amidase [Thermoflexaceae bacterium]